MKRPTLAISCLSGLFLGGVCLFPDTAWAQKGVKVSLIYPAYYGVVSLWHHRRVMRAGDEE